MTLCWFTVYLYNMVLMNKQEQNDLMREIEVLGEELKRSREELDKSHLDVSSRNFPF